MLKYAQIINQETKKCNVGTGTNSKFYESIGMTLQDVEQSYTGEWYLTGYAPTQSLDELKQIKLDELTEKQREFEQNVCPEMKITSSLGYVMDADIRSQTNLQGLIDVGQFPVTYICGDNVARQLSLEDLQTVKKECILNGQNLYAQKWNFQQQINNAQSQEELDKIIISFQMMDFTPAKDEITESSENSETVNIDATD